MFYGLFFVLKKKCISHFTSWCCFQTILQCFHFLFGWCAVLFLYMHDALLLSSKRCSVVPVSCAVRAYTNTPSHRPGCRTSAIDLWAFAFLPCNSSVLFIFIPAGFKFLNWQFLQNLLAHFTECQFERKFLYSSSFTAAF